MRIFLDTEFIEDGRTIDLISIALVQGDRELYLVSSEFDETKANDFVREHVLPKIEGEPRHTREFIAQSVLLFCGYGLEEGQQAEIWGYYADYDWVALCQLYGRMVDLPAPFPYFCLDLKQKCFEKGNPSLPGIVDEHHCLTDARWNQMVYRYLDELDR
jgi:hypothetical protein